MTKRQRERGGETDTGIQRRLEREGGREREGEIGREGASGRERGKIILMKISIDFKFFNALFGIKKKHLLD